MVLQVKRSNLSPSGASTASQGGVVWSVTSGTGPIRPLQLTLHISDTVWLCHQDLLLKKGEAWERHVPPPLPRLGRAAYIPRFVQVERGAALLAIASIAFTDVELLGSRVGIWMRLAWSACLLMFWRCCHGSAPAFCSRRHKGEIEGLGRTIKIWGLFFIFSLVCEEGGGHPPQLLSTVQERLRGKDIPPPQRNQFSTSGS